MIQTNSMVVAERQFEALSGCFMGSRPHIWVQCSRCEDRINKRSYASRRWKCTCKNGYVRHPVSSVEDILSKLEYALFPLAFNRAPYKGMRPIGPLEGIAFLEKHEPHQKTKAIIHYGYLIPMDACTGSISRICYYISFLKSSPIGEPGTWWRLSGETSFAEKVLIPRNGDDIPINTEVQRNIGILYQMKQVKYRLIDWTHLQNYLLDMSQPHHQSG